MKNSFCMPIDRITHSGVNQTGFFISIFATKEEHFFLVLLDEVWQFSLLAKCFKIETSFL